MRGAFKSPVLPLLLHGASLTFTDSRVTWRRRFVRHENVARMSDNACASSERVFHEAQEWPSLDCSSTVLHTSESVVDVLFWKVVFMSLRFILF